MPLLLVAAKPEPVTDVWSDEQVRADARVIAAALEQDDLAEAFSARPVICHHTKYIGTSHFTAGYLKVLNPPISLPSK